MGAFRAAAQQGLFEQLLVRSDLLETSSAVQRTDERL